MFEVSALDQWMEIELESNIKLKECPKCTTPIQSSLRYGNIVKRVLQDIYSIKQMIGDSEGKVRKSKTEGYQTCKEIETDIILLSLVRSNLNGQLGFMKIENRACVALSRAKIGSFVIGNFDMFEEQSSLWRKIVQDVKYMDALKDTLPIYCQNYPNTVAHVFDGQDFSCAPEGGCTKSCEFCLDCRHACQMACHPLDQNHKKYIC